MTSTTSNARGARPLEGVRVLDLTRGMPGAVATMLLADYGAEVIVVESPGGITAAPDRCAQHLGTGKRSVVLDLDAPGRVDGRPQGWPPAPTC